MTVENLITELQKMPKDTVVCGDDGTTTYQIERVFFAPYDTQTVLKIQWLPDNVEPS